MLGGLCLFVRQLVECESQLRSCLTPPAVLDPFLGSAVDFASADGMECALWCVGFSRGKHIPAGAPVGRIEL
jgi:hypothetical protein